MDNRVLDGICRGIMKKGIFHRKGKKGTVFQILVILLLVFIFLFSIYKIVEKIIIPLIRFIIEELILSSTYLLLAISIIIIIFILYFARSKTAEITDWIQPSIHSLSRKEISRIIFLNLFTIYPLFREYNIKDRELTGLKKKQKGLINDTDKTFNITDDYRQKKLKCQEKYKEKGLSCASRIEIDILSDKISREDEEKNKLQKQTADLEFLIRSKIEDLDKLNEKAYCTIMQAKIRYDEIYKKHIKFKKMAK